MVVGQRNAEHPLLPEPRSEALQQPLAPDRLLARSGKPCAQARRIRQQGIGAQIQRAGGRGKREASQLLACNAEDEIGLALGRGEVELETRARAAAVLEPEVHVLHAGSASPQAPLQLYEQALQREEQRPPT